MAAKWLASEAADDEVDDTETKARAYYCQTCDKWTLFSLEQMNYVVTL